MLIPLSLCLLLNGFDVLKWFNPNQIKVNENSAVIKIALSNVWKVNKKYDKLLEFVKNNNPDILVLQEVNARWLNNIKSLDKSYKYKTVIPRNDNFGIAVYSKKTLNNVQIIHSGRFKKPIILFNVNFYGKKVNFAAIHPTPPKNKVCFDSRNYQLNQVVDWIKSDNKTAIIVGDLNLSIFSPYYKQMIDDLSMLNSRKGNGLGLSWPTLVPKFFRIPIDQILHTSDITTIDFQMGSNIGSDHLPVIAVLKIK